MPVRRRRRFTGAGSEEHPNRPGTITLLICSIAVFLPLIGAVSDSLGIQASMIVLVPVSLAAGLVLASAHRFVDDDIAAVRAESLARVAAADAPT